MPGLAKGRNSSTITFQESFTAPTARILIVDDNPVNLHVACGLMKVYEMKIDTCESGYDALKVTENTPFDLIFMDHMMPGMDGVETVKTLRLAQGNQNSKTPVVALTANAISGMKEMFLANGFQDYLSKPMELRELDRILRELLRPEKVLPKEEGKAKEPPQETDQEIKCQKAGEDREVEADGLCKKARDHFLGSPLIDEKTATIYGIEEKKLSLFQLSYEASRGEMEKSCRDKDWESFHARVHGLKSASLFIGALHLSERAREAEEAAKRKDGEYIHAHLEEILKEGDALVALIQEVLSLKESSGGENPGEEETLEDQVLTREELLNKLAKIREDLELFDAVSAQETVRELLSLTIGKLSLGEWMEKLGTLIDLFSYEEAQTLLDELEKKLKKCFWQSKNALFGKKSAFF